MLPTAARSRVSSRILAEALQTPDEPLVFLLQAGSETSPATACAAAARALLDLPAVSPGAPSWLAPHQVPAHDRLVAILTRHGGAVLADAVGLGKSYVALAVARTLGAAPMLVVPAVLVRQWRALLNRLGMRGRIVSHEQLSRASIGPRWQETSTPPPLCIVDEAHHFRNPDTRRYRALARRVVGARVLLVSATPVHHRPAELFHLLRLFLRDDALVAVGVPSLIRVARDRDPPLASLTATARFVVARSRLRVTTAWRGLAFPSRTETERIDASPAPPNLASELVDGITQVSLLHGAGSLFRLTLLRRLASSVPALRETLRRFDAFLAIRREAAALQRRIRPREFRRLFPMQDGTDLQLTLLPLLLEADGAPDAAVDDGDLVRRLLDRTHATFDPKAQALARLLTAAPAKTIVFAEAAATVHHLRRRLAPSFRVAAVVGPAAWLGMGRSSRREVFEAFAPRAHGVAPPPVTSRVDILIATDLVGEGLNLQDARRVVHYDLPWSPARLAQRVGRIDRLASPHESVAVVTFFPPQVLAAAIAIEQRLTQKVTAQIAVGAAQVETIRGPTPGPAPLDWCDQLQPLAVPVGGDEPGAVVAAARADIDAVILIVRLGSLVEAIVVEHGMAVADAPRAASLLVAASGALSVPMNRVAFDQAVRAAAPLIRERLAALAAARWRTADRDGAGRRLVALALAAARRAARAGKHVRLGRLDALLARLCGGQTAGEALLLEQLLERRRPLDANDLLAWHEQLPPVTAAVDAPEPQLVAALLLVGPT